jgi:hypothetical protein
VTKRQGSGYVTHIVVRKAFCTQLGVTPFGQSTDILRADKVISIAEFVINVT